MPLMLCCPSCDHAAPLPETPGGRLVCSKCKSTIKLACFRGPRCWRDWQLWIVKSGLVLMPETPGARIEWRTES